MLDKPRRVTLAARDSCSLVPPAVSIEQFFEQASSNPVRCRANGQLARLKINMPSSLNIAQDTLQKSIYFLRRLPANCIRNFFFRASNSS